MDSFSEEFLFVGLRTDVCNTQGACSEPPEKPCLHAFCCFTPQGHKVLVQLYNRRCGTPYGLGNQDYGAKLNPVLTQGFETCVALMKFDPNEEMRGMFTNCSRN
jgi:hypothetical protein